MNVFKEMVHSIYDFKSYGSFLNNKKSKVFGFGVLLMFFYCLLTMIVPCIRFFAETGGLAAGIRENVPDFVLEDGVLWVEKPIDFDYSGIYISVDTDPESVFYGASELGDALRDYSQVLLMDQEKLIVKDNGQIQELYFSDMDMNFSKEVLISYVPYAYLIVAVFIVVAFFFMTAAYFFGVLVVALLGMIVASCMKKQYTFGQLYQMGIYTRTTPLLVKAVLSLCSLSIPMFFLINFGISLVYLAKGITEISRQQAAEPIELTTDQWNEQ